MALDPVFDSADSLPEDLKGLTPHLTQRSDGKYVLELSNNGKGQPNVDRLEEALRRERTYRTKAEATIEENRDLLDASDRAREALGKLDQMATWDGDKVATERAKEQVEAVRREAKREADKSQQIIASQQTQIEQYLRGSAVDKVVDGYGDAVLDRSLVRKAVDERVQMQRTKTDGGEDVWRSVYLDADGKPSLIDEITPDQVRAEVRKAHPSIFKPTTDIGSGSEPGVSAPSASGVTKTIRSDDLEALDQYHEEISKGTVRIVPAG